jgi:TetR/AcrR family transcriptional regulator, tetracycline repressor protein
MRLNRKIVLQTAMRLVNEVGLEGLTTRRLGEELGVEGPALYRHFRCKQELIDHMAGEILLPTISPVKPGQHWEDWLAERARTSRQAILACRDSAQILAGAIPPESEAVAEFQKPLREAGFSELEALFAVLSFGRFIIGWTSVEQSTAGREVKTVMKFDNEEAFEFGLQTLIAGLQLRLIRLTRQSGQVKSGERRKR